MPRRAPPGPLGALALGLLTLTAIGCGGRPAAVSAPPPWPTPQPVGADDPRRPLIGEWIEPGPPLWTTAARQAPRPRGGRPCRRRLIFTADGAFETVDARAGDGGLRLFTAEPAAGGLTLTIYDTAAPERPPRTLRVTLDGDRLTVDGDPRTYTRAAPLDGRILSGAWFEGDLRAALAEAGEAGDWRAATAARQRALDGLLLNHDDMWIIAPDLRETDGRSRHGRLVVLDAHGPERCVVRKRPGADPDRGQLDHLRRAPDRLIDDDGDVWVTAARRRETLARLAAAGFRVPSIVTPTLPDALRRSPWAAPPEAGPAAPTEAATDAPPEAATDAAPAAPPAAAPEAAPAE